MWELDHKKAERWRFGAFEMWCWRRLLSVPWTVRLSQSILKAITSEYSLEGLMLELKLQYFGHLITKSWLTGKDPNAGKDWGQEEKGVAEDEMVGWHHWLSAHEFEQTPGDGKGQGSLVCYSPWGHRVRHDSRPTTSQLKAVGDVHSPGHLFPDERDLSAPGASSDPLSPHAGKALPSCFAGYQAWNT